MVEKEIPKNRIGGTEKKKQKQKTGSCRRDSKTITMGEEIKKKIVSREKQKFKLYCSCVSWSKGQGEAEEFPSVSKQLGMERKQCLTRGGGDRVKQTDKGIMRKIID